MLVAELFDERIDVELFAEPSIELADTLVDLGAQLRQRFDGSSNSRPSCSCAASGRVAAFAIASSSAVPMPQSYHVTA
jgi:hypothetical protein